MIERNRPQRENTGPLQPLGGGFGDEPESESGAPVTVTSGPYLEQLPVGNASVGEIRRRFGDRLDIDPQSQAVLDGHAVGDETIVQPGQALMFTRHSGEKGATMQEQLTAALFHGAEQNPQSKDLEHVKVIVEGTEATACSAEGFSAKMPLANLLDSVAPPRMSTGPVILPDGLKTIMNRNKVTIWVHETPPAVHHLKWIAADSKASYGNGTTYRNVSLALPYVIIFAVYTHQGRLGNHLSQYNECFFRNAPLKTQEDELYFPALLNCSKFANPEGHPLSWICTQHLKPTPEMRHKDANIRMRGGFNALRHTLLETGFNRSSEHHEANSWYSESCHIDHRLQTVEAWEKASQEDSLFVLDLPWLKTGLNVKTMGERIFGNLQARGSSVNNAGALARLIFNQKT